MGLLGFRIADQSQTQYWLNGHLGETTQTTDFRLRSGRCFKTAGIRQSPALIVVHLMGNHGSYEERYPHAFNRWTENLILISDNGILYNDFVMKQLLVR